MIDHDLYTKYSETGRLTLTKYLLYYNTRVYRTHSLYVAILALTLSLLPSSTHLPCSWMDGMAREGGSIYRQGGIMRL